MKNAGLIFLAAVLVCLGTGCASSGKTVLRTQREPIALVSVASNWDINWKGEDSLDPDTVIGLAKRSLRKDPDLTFITNAEELINTAEAVIREIMTGPAVISLAEKDRVLFSQAYRNARINKRRIIREEVKPDNYLFVDHRDKNFPSALAAETGIQRTMYVDFNFTKFMATGFAKMGTLRAEVEMAVQILDVSGKTIYKKTVTMGSSSTSKVSNGAYLQTELLSLFEDTIIDVCYELLDILSD